MDNLYLSLRRIGWRPSQEFGAFIWIDDNEMEIKLTAYSPNLLCYMMLEAYQRLIERQLGEQLGLRDDRAQTQVRALVDVARTKIRSKRTDALGKSLVACAFCDSIWTTARARACGYDIEVVCPLCGEPEDGVAHRLFRCQHPDVVAARQECLTPKQLRSLPRNRAEQDSLLWTRGIAPNPCSWWPKPAEADVAIHFEYEGEKRESLDGFDLAGDFFWDGSASREEIRDLNRAGWGVAFCRPNGTVFARAWGPVWCTLPQTPQASEYVGFAASCQLVNGASRGHGDCMNVVRDASAARSVQTSARRRYAGVMRSTFGCEGREQILSVDWCAGHVKEKLTDDEFAALPDHDRWLAAMNEAADEAADAGRLLHPQPNGCERAEVRLLLAELRCFYSLASNVLRLWPKLPGGLTRFRRGNRQRRGGHKSSLALRTIGVH